MPHCSNGRKGGPERRNGTESDGSDCRLAKGHQIKARAGENALRLTVGVVIIVRVYFTRSGRRTLMNEAGRTVVGVIVTAGCPTITRCTA